MRVQSVISSRDLWHLRSMDPLLKIPGKRQAMSQYFYSSEFGALSTILATGDFVSLLYYWSSWLNALMWKGYKQELKHEDLYATPEESLSQVLYDRFNKWVYVSFSYVSMSRGYGRVSFSRQSTCRRKCLYSILHHETIDSIPHLSMMKLKSYDYSLVI